MKSETKKNIVKALLATTAISPFVAFAPLMAEEVAQANDDKGETVIVTARRREETLLKVPVAVTAFTGKALEQRGITDITQVAKAAPNVTLAPSRGTNSTLTAFIRGVGQQDPVAGFEAGVGIYVDDVYFNRPQASVLDVYEVERIEVLRGPQGTLYGRNTVGGAIKYVTKKLRSEPYSALKVNVGSYNQIDGIFTMSAPVSDKFAIGGSIARLHRDGFGENIINGKENYNKEILAGRLSAEWTPNDAIFIRLSGDASNDYSNARQGHRVIKSLLTGTEVLKGDYDTMAGLYNPEQKVVSSGMALNASWKLNDVFTLKNIVALRQDNSSTPIDFDSLPSADLDVPAIYKNKQFSEELQLAVSTEKLNGVIGAYYLDADAITKFDVVLANTGAILSLPGLTAQTFGNVQTKTWSIFGDFTYDLSENFALSLGGRYTSDERHSIIWKKNLLNGPSPEFGGKGVVISTTSNFDGTKEFTKFNPRVSLSWKPDNNNNLYASYSQGFKGGGFDPRGTTTAARDFNGNGTVDSSDIFEFMMFDPETVDSYELGWKTSLFGGRVTSNMAAFLSKYKNKQVPGSVGYDADGDGVNETFIGITSNAGEATMPGFEWEGNALLAENIGAGNGRFNVAWSAGYIDPTYDKYVNALNVDIKDTAKFQNTPKVTASGSAIYRTSAFGGSMALIGTASYRSEQSQFESANKYLDQDAFTLFDLSVTYTSNDGMWDLGLYGKNLTDERYTVAGYDFMRYNAQGVATTPTLGLEGTLTAFYGDPRTVTLSLTRRF